METKICSKCKRELPATLEYFYKFKGAKDDLRPNCKKCGGQKFGIYNVKELNKNVEDGYKICTRCCRKLPATIEYFHVNNTKYDGFEIACKECKGFKFTKSKPAVKSGYKLCNKCKRELPVTMFYKEKNTNDNLNHSCIECTKEKLRNSYINNKEKIDAYNKKYHKENADKIKEYRYKNKEKLNYARKQHYKANKEKVLEYIRRYKKENIEKYKIYKHSYYAKQQLLPYTLTLEEWECAKRTFNNECAYCGGKKSLTQDHFIPQSKGGGYTNDNIIPCCQSCNCSKKANNFFDWYPKQPFYLREREQKILDYLEYNQKQSISS